MINVNIKKYSLLFLLATITIQAAQPANTWYNNWYNNLVNLFSSSNIKKEHVAAGAITVGTIASLYYLYNTCKTKPSSTTQNQPKIEEAPTIPVAPMQFNVDHVAYAIAASMSSIKNDMQDYFSFGSSTDSRFAIFSVFDGHGGSFVAKTLAYGAGRQEITPMAEYKKAPNEESPRIIMPPLNQIILTKLTQDPNLENLLKNEQGMTKIFTDSFAEADALLTSEKMALNPSGSTATIALIDRKNKNLYVAYVGDSKAIIYNPITRPEIRMVTEDHDYYNQDEINRFKQKDPEAYNEYKDTIAKTHKVSRLDTSRTLGDRTVKERIPAFITPSPQIVMEKLKSGDMIVLASDGLWKAIINKNSTSYLDEYDTIGKTMKKLYDYNASTTYNTPISTPTEFRTGNDSRANYYAEKLHRIGVPSKDDVTVIVIYP